MNKQIPLIIFLSLGSFLGCQRSESRSARELSETLIHLERRPIDANRLYYLSTASRLSVNLGNIPMARQLVQEEVGVAKGVQSPDERARYLHQAFTTMGRIALREHRLDYANADLLASGQALSLGHPAWFLGPDMSLAKELLEAGERDVVLKYLALCQRNFPSIKTVYWRVSIWFGFLPPFANLL